jgi:hypothetical protein
MADERTGQLGKATRTRGRNSRGSSTEEIRNHKQFIPTESNVHGKFFDDKTIAIKSRETIPLRGVDRAKSGGGVQSTIIKQRKDIIGLTER